jgi:hypothetical protein
MKSGKKRRAEWSAKKQVRIAKADTAAAAAKLRQQRALLAAKERDGVAAVFLTP